MNYVNDLKAEIMKNGYKQDQISEKLGMNYFYFNKKLNMQVNKKSGKQFVFTLREMIQICKILNASMDKIFLQNDVA